MFWTLLLACGAEPPPAPPPDDGASLSDALSAIQAGDTPAPPPGEAPPAPGRSDETEAPSPEASPEDPACVAAKDKRAGLEARINGFYTREVKPKEDAYSDASSEMRECVHDTECAEDGPKAAELLEAKDEAAEEYAEVQDQANAMRAGLFAIDQEIALACGR